jgi:hypothetical protein
MNGGRHATSPHVARPSITGSPHEQRDALAAYGCRIASSAALYLPVARACCSHTGSGSASQSARRRSADSAVHP